MKRILSVILMVVVCSGYFFPVTLKLFPIANSKMILAAIGLILFVWEHVRYKSSAIRKELLPVILFGGLFSLSSFNSVVYNGTNDFVFVTYCVSMAVWLGGAYCVVCLLKGMYGTVSLQTVFWYMGVMCAGQCIVAVMIDNIPALKNLVDSVFGISGEYFEKTPRLYGIGASFDTAGIRFSCVLLGIGYLIKHSISRRNKDFCILLLFIIGIIGNMISRTTVVGLAVTFAYLLMSSTLVSWFQISLTSEKLLWGGGLCLSIVLLYSIGVYMYDNMAGVRKAFDYGFEGFVNWYETGVYSTHSSDLLLNNVFSIYPDNMKTWMIGDGYFSDPYDSEKFYMGTDMGYIRYIFYCGIIGLLFFLSYFISCTYVLCKRECNMNLFFVCLFVIQLIVWIKIPTDIFCFYALLLLADSRREAIEVSKL